MGYGGFISDDERSLREDLENAEARKWGFKTKEELYEHQEKLREAEEPFDGSHVTF